MKTKTENMFTSLEKKYIAITQLRRAIQLFKEKDYICATTLAGAAEEIFGKTAKSRSGHCALDFEVNFWEGFAELIGHMSPEKKKVYNSANRLKNEFKHNASGQNEYIKANLEFEADQLISRAIMNYRLAYQEDPKDKLIQNFITAYYI